MYQASVEGFCSELGVNEDEALRLIGRSVAIAKEARKQHTSGNVRTHVWDHVMSHDSHMTKVLIAGSVGPYGACQHDGSEYTGNYVDHMTREVSHVTSQLTTPPAGIVGVAQCESGESGERWSGPVSL